MRIYKIETTFSRYTIIAEDFDAAFSIAKKFRNDEQKELKDEDQIPDIDSIVAGDEISEVTE